MKLLRSPTKSNAVFCPSFDVIPFQIKTQFKYIVKSFISIHYYHPKTKDDRLITFLLLKYLLYLEINIFHSKNKSSPPERHVAERLDKVFAAD